MPPHVVCQQVAGRLFGQPVACGAGQQGSLGGVAGALEQHPGQRGEHADHTQRRSRPASRVDAKAHDPE